MESDVGLDQLSPNQRDFYYAACLEADADQMVHSEQVRGHPMLTKMARATFYLALRDLVKAGYLSAAGDARSGVYRILR
jgi:hypothetical protein